MKYSIQYQEELQGTALPFDWVELPWYILRNYAIEGATVSGISVQLADINAEEMKLAIQYAQAQGASYIVIGTEYVPNIEALLELIVQCKAEIQQDNIHIYIENGFLYDERIGYICSPFSEVSMLLKLAAVCGQACGKQCFGLALNVGYANLTGKNLRVMVEEAGSALQLVHLNDNDGIHNDYQMPFTFTKGRGARTTDWYRLVGALVRVHFSGWMVWNATGVFEKAPAALHKSFLNIMESITEEWEYESKLEEHLNQPGKKLILFGTGKMAYNYICEWGYRYPVEFFVDNNRNAWGTKAYDIDVKSPEAILEIPADERVVCICNCYYKEVGEQLTKMGVEYFCYNDNYYM